MFGPAVPLLGTVVWYLLAAPKDCCIYVVFGRPGAGKTTIANLAVEKLRQQLTVSSSSSSKSFNSPNDDDTPIILGLDLDVCVPDWMKENFANGIYPTLEQRKVFAQDACDYVARELEQAKSSLLSSTANDSSSSSSSAATATTTTTTTTVSVVSFSFVNTDLRDVFRERFPHAEWILIDTTPTEANRRIQLRQGHFYNQETSDDDDTNTTITNNNTEEAEKPDNPDNDEWNFAPVTFDHVILNGNDDIATNAEKIVEQILQNEKVL